MLWPYSWLYSMRNILMGKFLNKLKSDQLILTLTYFWKEILLLLLLHIGLSFVVYFLGKVFTGPLLIKSLIIKCITGIQKRLNQTRKKLYKF